MLQFVIIFTMVRYELPQYESYHYPWWAHLIGWLVTAVMVAPIPMYACYVLHKTKGDSLKLVRLY